jgi:thiosulfate dehydrogenase [quinone] large subunit
MQETATIEEPGFARWLFASTQAAWIWLIVRLYLGYEWLHAGFSKITGLEGGTWSWHLGYTGDSWLKSPKALQGFLAYALSNANKGPNSSLNYGWYASFLRWMSHPGPAGFFSRVIPFTEMAIGLAMILGLFVGIAAFLGGTLNFSFGLAGVSGVNPVFFVLEVLLVLAWRNAGYIGLDRYALPALGTPWRAGRAFTHQEEHPQGAAA